MVKCRICKSARAHGRLPICQTCSIRGERGHLSWIRRRRYRRLFIDLTNSGYEQQDPNGYAFVRQVLITNDERIPWSADDHTTRDTVAIISLILLALGIVLRLLGFY